MFAILFSGENPSFLRANFPSFFRSVLSDKTVMYKNSFYSWSREEDSNPQPSDYKSLALPIELSRHYLHLFITFPYLPFSPNSSVSSVKVLKTRRMALQFEKPFRVLILHFPIFCFYLSTDIVLMLRNVFEICRRSRSVTVTEIHTFSGNRFRKPPNGTMTHYR